MSAGDLRPNWRADLALVLVVLIWGATFVVVKEALRDVSTLLFLALRFSLASVALAVVFAGRARARTAVRQSLTGGVLAGLCLFGGYFFQTVGLRYTSASRSAFITAMSVVMVPFLVSLVHKSVPSLAEVAGVALALVGLGMLTLETDSLIFKFGELLTLICALGFAVHILVLSHYSGRASLELMSFAQVSTAALIALGTCWWTEPLRVHWTPGLVAALAITGLLATALAFTVQTWAQRHTSPTRTALILTLEPVFAWATSFLLLGERLSKRGMAGGALILSGVLLAELKPAWVRRHPLQ